MNRLSRRRSPRGMSMIEAMIAAAVLGIGILGSFGGMVLASRQNSSAARLGRADAIATAVRSGLQVKSYAQLSGANGPFDPGQCTGAAAVLALTNGLSGVAPTCVVDLDAFDTAAAPVNRIVPSYNPADGAMFRRVLVMWNNPAVGPIEIRTVAIVVSFKDGLGTRFVQQFTGTYNPAANLLGIEI